MSQTAFVRTKDFYIEKYTLKNPQAAMHYHPSNELYYILDGEREYFIENKFMKAVKGDFVFVPQNLLHRTDGKGATRILIYFSNDFLRRYFSDDIIAIIMSGFRPEVFRPGEETGKKLYSIISKLLFEYTHSTAKATKTDDANFACLLFELLYTISTSKNTFLEESFADSRLNHIVRYINENFCHITSLDELAEKFYISKYHLCHIFSDYLGTQIIAYINMMKIREACRMIDTGKYKITEISSACGFNSSSYFSKVFKKEMGMSPQEYRRQRQI